MKTYTSFRLLCFLEVALATMASTPTMTNILASLGDLLAPDSDESGTRSREEEVNATLSKEEEFNIEASFEDDSTDANGCSLMTMLPYSTIESSSGQESEALNKFSAVLSSRMAMGFTAATMLAMEHFNFRDTSIVPELADVYEDCSFYFSRPKYVDSRADGRTSVRALWEHFSSYEDRPCAVLAPLSEEALIQTVPAVDAFDVPMINYFAEGADLSSATSVGNLVLSKQGLINAIAEYFKDRKYIAVWSESGPFDRTFGDYEFPGDVEVLTIRNSNPALMKSNVKRMKASGIKTIYCDITSLPNFINFADAVNDQGLLDDGTLFILPPSLAKSDDVEILFSDVEEGSPLDKLLSGALVFDRLDGFRFDPSNDPMLKTWRAQDDNAVARMNMFAPPSSKLKASENFFQSVDPTNYASFAYDAVIAIGMGACSLQAEEDRLAAEMQAEQERLKEEQRLSPQYEAATESSAREAPTEAPTPGFDVPVLGFLFVVETQEDEDIGLIDDPFEVFDPYVFVAPPQRHNISSPVHAKEAGPANADAHKENHLNDKEPQHPQPQPAPSPDGEEEGDDAEEQDEGEDGEVDYAEEHDEGDEGERDDDEDSPPVQPPRDPRPGDDEDSMLQPPPKDERDPRPGDVEHSPADQDDSKDEDERDDEDSSPPRPGDDEDFLSQPPRKDERDPRPGDDEHSPPEDNDEDEDDEDSPPQRPGDDEDSVPQPPPKDERDPRPGEDEHSSAEGDEDEEEPPSPGNDENSVPQRPPKDERDPRPGSDEHSPAEGDEDEGDSDEEDSLLPQPPRDTQPGDDEDSASPRDGDGSAPPTPEDDEDTLPSPPQLPNDFEKFPAPADDPSAPQPDEVDEVDEVDDEEEVDEADDEDEDGILPLPPQIEGNDPLRQPDNESIDDEEGAAPLPPRNGIDRTPPKPREDDKNGGRLLSHTRGKRGPQPQGYERLSLLANYRRLKSGEGDDDVSNEGPTTLHEAILAQDFSGASGKVKFEQEGSNSRNTETVAVGLYNIRPTQSSDSGIRSYQSVLVSKYTVESKWVDVPGTSVYHRINSAFINPSRIYASENFISGGVRAIGLILMVLAWSIALVGSILLVILRKDNVIQRAQPFFMQILCWGSITMSTSIFTLSWDEGAGWSDAQLDMSCTLTPWFFFFGQIMTFCALFTKLWRVDRVLQFRRRVVTISNVMKPTLVLMTVTIVILSLWTVMDPWTWERELIVEIPAETYGQCESDNIWWYFGPLVGLLCFAEALTLYYAWKTADVPEDFRDSGAVMYAAFAQLQSFAIGVPMLAVLGQSSAEATYFGRIFLIWIFAVSSVAVVVGPKVIRAVQLRLYPEKANQKGRVSVTGVYARDQPPTGNMESSYNRSFGNRQDIIISGTSSEARSSAHLPPVSEAEQSLNVSEL